MAEAVMKPKMGAAGWRKMYHAAMAAAVEMR